MQRLSHAVNKGRKQRFKCNINIVAIYRCMYFSVSESEDNSSCHPTMFCLNRVSVLSP